MDRRLKARSKTPHTPSPVRPQGPKTWEEGATVYFSTPALASQCSQALLREPGSRCSTLKSTRGSNLPGAQSGSGRPGPC